jgi:hypothetical protein
LNVILEFPKFVVHSISIDPHLEALLHISNKVVMLTELHILLFCPLEFAITSSGWCFINSLQILSDQLKLSLDDHVEVTILRVVRKEFANFWIGGFPRRYIYLNSQVVLVFLRVFQNIL